MTISPALTPAQTCAARMLSAALADSTKTKRGSRLCKSRRTWSLAAALRRRCSSPIDAGGNQGNCAGVHHVNDAPETPRQTFTSTPSAKAGRKRLEASEHRPEQPFGQRRVALFVGVGKVIAARRGCPAQGRKRPAMQPQRVTDIVEANRMGQLRKEHADHVTPGTEGSRLGIHAGLARKFRDEMCWNQIAKLSENREFGGGWFGVSFFH